jgi:hypothetical protein
VTAVVLLCAPVLLDPSPAAAQRWAQERFGSVDLSSYDFRAAFVTPTGSLALVCGRKKR